MELYIKLESALHHLLFVSNATNEAIFLDYVSLLLQVHPVPIGIQWDHGVAEVEAIEAQAMDPNVLYMKLKCTSKPIVDATNSEVDAVKLLQAYGMVRTEVSELRHRRKKVATDEITIVPIQTLGNLTFEP